MGIEGNLFLGLLFFAYALNSNEAHPGLNRPMALVDRTSKPLLPSYGLDKLNRSSFPAGFVFGAASSAYQVEGAWNEDGKGPSNWDVFTHTYPEKIKDHSNGDVAVDSYHRYKEDVQIVKGMNLDAYRFSISWSRVLPTGKLSGGVNEAGIQYYNNLINELVANGLQSYVTIFHWDVPQALEEAYGGFLSPKIVDDFHDFANLCFERFGDRVKHWITLNEPWTFAVQGYDSGIAAPGRCSSWRNNNCTGGNSATEPYIVTHYQILAHTAAARLYRTKYKILQPTQKGMIGITLVTNWMVPASNSSSDIRASRRALDFSLGWYMDPLVFGDYSHLMKTLVGARLPRFTAEQSNSVKGSLDFLGLNYYTANYAAHVTNFANNVVNVSYTTDDRANHTTSINGVPIGEKAGSDWLYVYPQGIKDTLLYIKKNYKNPVVYITENGIDEINNSSLTLKQALTDNFRIRYYSSHLANVIEALKEGADVRGFFAWAIMDNFEWASGFTSRFGLNYVDYARGLKRYPKLSAKWFTNFLKK